MQMHACEGVVLQYTRGQYLVCVVAVHNACTVSVLCTLSFSDCTVVALGSQIKCVFAV